MRVRTSLALAFSLFAAPAFAQGNHFQIPSCVGLQSPTPMSDGDIKACLTQILLLSQQHGPIIFANTMASTSSGGSSGAAGPAGPAGANGATGATGATGLQGPAGSPGPAGLPGTPAPGI